MECLLFGGKEKQQIFSESLSLIEQVVFQIMYIIYLLG